MKILSFVLIGMSLLIASCRKENKNPSVNPLQDKLKTSKSVLANGSVSNDASYLYDEQGRLVKITAVNGPTTEYNYAPGKVFLKTTQPNGTIENSQWDVSANGGIANQSTSGADFTYYLNDAGYVKKLLITKYNNGIWSETEVRDYYYNAAGMLDSIAFYTNAVKTSSVMYTGYTGKPDLSNEQTGRSYLPKQFKNFYIQSSIKNAQGNIIQANILEYKLDAKGRKSELIVKVNGNLSVTNTYTYYD